MMANKKSKSVLSSRFSNKLGKVLLRVTGGKYRLHQQDRVCPGTRLKEVCGHKAKVRPVMLISLAKMHFSCTEKCFMYQKQRLYLQTETLLLCQKFNLNVRSIKDSKFIIIAYDNFPCFTRLTCSSINS